MEADVDGKSQVMLTSTLYLSKALKSEIMSKILEIYKKYHINICLLKYGFCLDYFNKKSNAFFSMISLIRMGDIFHAWTSP